MPFHSSRETKRAAIMKAVLALVAEQGFHGTSMAMIAARSGVAAGTLYRYFESKDDLILQTYANLELEILRTATAGFSEVHTLEKRFVHMAENLLRYYISSPIELRFLRQFRTSPYGHALRREQMFRNSKNDVANDLFLKAARKHLVKELPPTVLFDLGFSSLVTIADHHHVGLINLDGYMIARVVESCWNAIRL